MKELNNIQGIVVPLITPLKTFDKLDVDGLENLINRVVESGASGITILGNTGEEKCLDFNLRQEIISEACRIVNKRIPLLVSISETSLSESYIMANYAATCGASGVVSAPPYYLTAGQDELIEYYKKLVDMIPLPIMLYNLPPISGTTILNPETLIKLSKKSQIFGIKEGSANNVYLQTILYRIHKYSPNFKVFVGTEESIGTAVISGADGGMAGGANIFPKLYVAMYNSAKNKDLIRCSELQKYIMQISHSLYSIGRYHSSYLKGIKCALNILDIISDDYMAPPFNKFLESERNKIIKSLEVLKKKIPCEYTE